jgi:hypothetical protein
VASTRTVLEHARKKSAPRARPATGATQPETPLNCALKATTVHLDPRLPHLVRATATTQKSACQRLTPAFLAGRDSTARAQPWATYSSMGSNTNALQDTSVQLEPVSLSNAWQVLTPTLSLASLQEACATAKSAQTTTTASQHQHTRLSALLAPSALQDGASHCSALLASTANQMVTKSTSENAQRAPSAPSALQTQYHAAQS